MSSVPRPSDLAATEERYYARQAERDEALHRLNEGGILAADDPARVRRRLARLGVDETAASAVDDLTAFTTGPRLPAPTVVALERLLGTNDLVGIAFLLEGYAVGRAVARIEVGAAAGQLEGYGTGFMVSPRLLLTNNHVFPSADVAGGSLAQFDYEAGPDGKLHSSVAVRLDSDAFFATSLELDYSLVAVAAPATVSDLRSFGWTPLIEQEGKAIIGEFVNIIQHPGGAPKQLALRENQVVDVHDAFLQYRTDTAPGSSGSPVFNDQWEVVALHHSGVPKRDEQGNILAIGGGVWDQSMGEQRIDWIANEGIRVSRILKDIRERVLTGQQAVLRDELVAAPAPPAPEIASNGGTVTSAGAGSVTIPLRLTLDLGGSGAADAELSAALAELESAPTRPYYDEETDSAARAAYYAGLDAEASPSDLYRALNELVTRTHANKPAYRPSVRVYPWVDLRDDLRLRSIYSGKDLDPVTLINEDFRIERERASRLAERTAAEALVPGRLEEELDLLEAALPYNCEHVVCQSWFAKHEPMRGDVHHLFACEPNCNSFRSNIPYFQFPPAPEVVRADCGRREPVKFEPANARGTVARAALYFLLRYPHVIVPEALAKEGFPGDLRQLLGERIDTLLSWHAAEPATTFELHRNAAVFELQGNRNPLIDLPEVAARSDFTLALAV
jgi:endonuclease G, mitochondrial